MAQNRRTHSCNLYDGFALNGTEPGTTGFCCVEQSVLLRCLSSETKMISVSFSPVCTALYHRGKNTVTVHSEGFTCLNTLALCGAMKAE